MMKNIKAYLIAISSLFIIQTAFAQNNNNSLPNQGNVGVGTSNPAQKLHVNGHVRVDSSMVVADSLRVKGDLKVGSNSLILRESGGASEIFTTGTGEPLKIQSLTYNNNLVLNAGNTGKVGIGTTNPTSKLHVNGDLRISDGNIKLESLSTHGSVDPCAKLLMVDGNGNLLLQEVTGASIADPCSQPTAQPFWGIYGNTVLNHTRVLGTRDNYDFSIISNDLKRITIKSDGKIGIGTVSPTSLFHCESSSSIDAKFYATSASISRVWSMNSLASIAVGVDASGKGHIFSDVNNPVSLMTFHNGGVGIGTTNPTANGHKLAVNGSIRAKKIIVETGWADHVFDTNYELRSISELKNYIITHRHLPGVPTAEEVSKNGVDLAESNVMLLEKIEELTLYIIQLEDRQSRLEQQLQNRK